MFAVVAVACDTPVGDLPSEAGHSVLGPGMRLRDVQNPANNLANQNVDITSVVVSAVDTFDETHNGKSLGTVFVQDADITGPLAGISMYSPTYIPANLRLAPGDVVNIVGQYSEQHTIGSTVNFGTSFLPQMNKPQVTPSFETQAPQPIVVQLSDLETFGPDADGGGNGRKWVGMLIQLQDVTVAYAPTGDGTGRVTAPITDLVNSPAVNNELWDLPENSFPAGTHFTSITGICDFFFNIYIAPRSAADLVQ